MAANGSGRRLGGGRIEQKRKKAHGHGRQGSGCLGEGCMGGLNGNEKNNKDKKIK